MRGHIARKGKKWYPVWYCGKDLDGKKKYKWERGFDTKKEAQRFLAEKLVQLNNGIPEPSRDSLGTYLLQWLEDKRPQIRPGTFRSYEWLLKKHIVPMIGHMALADIKPQHIQELYTKLQSPEIQLSNQSVLNAHRILVQALNRAVKWDLIHKNPASAVHPPRPSRVEMAVWSEQELKRFLEHTRNSRYHIAYVLLSSTGMRLGELLALRWSDVNLECGEIHITRSLSYTGKGYKIQEPKTRSGRRTITIPKSVVRELIKHRVKQHQERLKAGELWQDNDLVVATALGRPVLQHNIRMQFQKYIEQLGLKRIRIHDLRHTHATILLKRGIHPKVVQERLGHSDISLTLNTYSHVLPSLQEAAAAKIDDLYA